MKKITAFFLAFMPMFVIVLLFLSGLIVKNITHVRVQAVEISESSLDIQKTKDDAQETYQLSVNVLPMNATNPEVYWTSSDESIVKVDNKGLITTNSWGEAYIYVTSKESPTIMDKCKVEVWDNRIHKIVVDNSYEAGYLPYKQTVQLKTHTIPSTRLTVDPTLTYESDKPSSVEVYKDGTIRSIGSTDTEATITIKPKATPTEGQPEVKQTFDVKVRAGVVVVEPKEATKTVTSQKTYNFSNEIKSFPDEKVISSDYTYEVSDPSIATVSNDKDTVGLVTFLQKNKDVKVTATYKRNKNLIVEKTLASTCQFLDKVYFNAYEQTIDLKDKPIGSYLDIKYATYPTNQENTKIEFSTTDKDVVVPERDPSNIWKFRIAGVGTAILTATITLDEQGNTASDYCLVNVTNTNETNLFISNEVSVDSYYYSLRNNINYNAVDRTNQNISWSLATGSEQYATLDDDNWIIHFKPTVSVGQTISINATWAGRNFNFQLTCNHGNMVDLDETKTTFNLEVGKKYTFADYYVRGLSEQDFDCESTSGIIAEHADTFIPKHGGKYTAYLEDSIFAQTEITLLISENPAGIKYKAGFKHYNPIVAKTFEVNTSLEPIIVPSTAAKADGTPYSLNIKYVNDTSTAVVENNKITFKDEALVLGFVYIDDVFCEDNIFGIYSTFGQVGKFTMKDGDTTLVSGDTLSFKNSQTKKLVLGDILTQGPKSAELTSQIKFTSLNGNNIISTPGAKWDGDNVYIELTAIHSGLDVISIYSPTFSLILNVHVDQQTTDILLYHNGLLLSSKNQTVTITPNFSLTITPYPLRSKDDCTVKIKKIDGTGEKDLTLSGHTLNITDQDMTSTGEWLITVKSGTITKTWTINYQTELQELSICLAEAEESPSNPISGTIYMSAWQTRFAATLVINNGTAIVPDKFYSYFYLKVPNKTVEKQFNKFFFDIQSPDKGSTYEEDVLLQYQKDQEDPVTIHTYHVTREQVARITLPNHDNNDLTDKKGLQKVHVFGNSTFETPEEGLINYYKLPINLYDYKNQLITGENKKIAYNSLKKYVTIGNEIKPASSYLTYNDTSKFTTGGFVEVHFDDNYLYSFLEIYDNKFADQNSHKNFSTYFITHSLSASANYMFVPVNATNAYCQEAFHFGWTPHADNKYSYVLQVDFEREGVPLSKTNMPFDRIDWYMGWNTLYGNGHIINFHNQLKAYIEGKSDKTQFETCHLINATLQGANSTDLVGEWWSKTRFANRIHTMNKESACHAAYCDISYFYIGLYVYASNGEVNSPVYAKNCMVHNNTQRGVSCNDKGAKLYMEDSVFFNAASFAIVVQKQGALFMKGFVDVYNFKTGQQIFSDIGGVRVPWVWNLIRPIAQANNVLHISASGAEVINSCCGNMLGSSIYFYNGLDEQGHEKWELLEHGTKYSAQHWFNFVNTPQIPEVGEVGMWATIHPNEEQGAPSYYDEFNEEGVIRAEFYDAQLRKISRLITWF